MSDPVAGPPYNAEERVIAITNRVGELLREHFTARWPLPPGKYEMAIDANYKDLPLVLTVRLTVDDSGARTLTIVSHEQGDPRTETPLFTGHWHVQGEYEIKLWRGGPWEALFLAGDIAGTA